MSDKAKTVLALIRAGWTVEQAVRFVTNGEGGT